MCGDAVRLLTALLVAAAMGYPNRRSATDLDATPRMTVTFDGKRARGGNRKEAHSVWERFTVKTVFLCRAVRCAAVQRAQPELHHTAAGGRAGYAVCGRQGGHLCSQCQQCGRWLAPHGELLSPFPSSLQALGVGFHAVMALLPVQIRWEASPEKQLDCLQKGRNNKVRPLPGSEGPVVSPGCVPRQ